MNPYQSYRVLIRGDRSFDLYNTPIVNTENGLLMHDATKLKATGTLVYGTVTYSFNGVTNNITGSTYASASYGLSTAKYGYSYIANPYDCPIDFHNIYSNGHITNMVDGYWYLDPTIGATGKYVAYNAIANTTNTGASFGNFIQPGQGFLVGNNNSSSPTLKITEADKSILSTSKTAVFGIDAPTSKIVIDLLSGVNSSQLDAAVAVFGNNFSNGFGMEDSRKLANGADNLSLKEDTDYLSIDARLPATASDILNVNFAQPSTKTYQLKIDASRYINNGFTPSLFDAYKSITTPIDSVSIINFTVDTAIKSSYQDRFSVKFKPTALAINSIIATASLSNNIATISWNTLGEKGVSRFEIEKSTDAKTFTSIGKATAKNTAYASYSATDNSVTATSYYRIKAISEVGAVSYSNIVLVKLTIDNYQLSIYPNPLVGKTLNVSFGNVAAGNYTITINNVLGQKMVESAISHSGSSANHPLTINCTLAAGAYNVVVRDASGKQVYQSNLSVQP